VITDGGGVPLAVTLTGANRNDVTQLMPLLDAVPSVRGRRGRPRRRPDRLYADRAYDHDKYRKQACAKGIRPFIARRGVDHGSGLGVHRWVVEQTLALLHWFRRLRIRWEIRDDIHETLPQPRLLDHLLATPPTPPVIALGPLSPFVSVLEPVAAGDVPFGANANSGVTRSPRVARSAGVPYNHRTPGALMSVTTTDVIRRSELAGQLKITTGIAGEETPFRARVRDTLVRAGESVVVVGEAYDGGAAVELALRQRPQVMLMDAATPGLNCLSALREVRRLVPATRVVLLAADTGPLLVSALRAGAAGFLVQHREPVELVKAVRGAADGQVVLCPAVTRALVEQLTVDSPERVTVERREHAQRLVDQLTARERDVLAHVAKGMGNVQIARAMWLSEGSIKAHIGRVLTKLRCDNRLQAALVAHDAEVVRQY
jgi:DNA-binding NarL/FixJ family response regulator